MATLAAAGVTLRNQINEAFPGRDKASDGWIGDAAHQARVSDHNPDRRGIVHAIDVDEDLAKKVDARELADELVELARTGVFLYTGAGAASILKLALLGLGFAFPVARFELYLAATLLASVASHMSGRWRHWSLLDRRTLKQD